MQLEDSIENDPANGRGHEAREHRRAMLSVYPRALPSFFATYSASIRVPLNISKQLSASVLNYAAS